ncbi:hypothetical protein IFM89_011685 [Coptis chinensis]|uniref:60S ribosomal export protein NMD3 n=1 Tax=Coptis chinensis TaxID=261450 RepID=A0A835GVV0_9MAGN|nr:hypothetical protein IFM89_011685 [Coptis chinensis]
MWYCIGADIGSGIFVLTGQEAKGTVGPAMVLSYAISGVSAMLSVFCYTEFTVEIPTAGKMLHCHHHTPADMWQYLDAFLLGLAEKSHHYVLPECKKFLQPPRTWIRAELESKELLTFCIKRLKNLSKVRLVNAEFVWTEPHSKRIKVKLNVQKEVLNGVKLEQAYITEYVVTDHMCESCSRVQANPDQWVAAVQLPQHVSHRRLLFYLEQLILKHDAAVRAIKINQMDEDIDFFFSSRSHALKFLEFMGKVVPIKSRNDKQLVSHDTKSNDYNYKHTFSVEICPVCREDLVCLPPKVVVGLGNLGPLVLCAKVTNNIVLVDPFTLRHVFLDADQYWRLPFRSLLSYKQLVEYIVLDVESVS